MGLDMFAYTADSNKVTVENDRTIIFNKTNDEDRPVEICYWRKHHDLHGWMEDLWLEKGGEGEFNCASLVLTLEDLDALEESIMKKRLPQTTGFFFGNNPPNEESDQYDLEFVSNARKALNQGKVVWYDSWW
jgi:hypothetical protein